MKTDDLSRPWHASSIEIAGRPASHNPPLEWTSVAVWLLCDASVARAAPRPLNGLTFNGSFMLPNDSIVERSRTSWGFMSRVTAFRRPLIIVATVIVADLVGGLSFGFQISRVVPFEAALFGAASLLLLWAAKRDTVDSRIVESIDLWLAGLFALGSIRAGLWAGGLPVSVANLAVLGVAIVTAVGFMLRRWLSRRHRAA